MKIVALILCLLFGAFGSANAELLFFDDFEYETPTDGTWTDSNNPFTTTGPWSNANTNKNNVTIYTDIWTVDFSTFQTNTGASGTAFPSGESRVVRYDFENREGGTNGYLYTNSAYPADIWIQFWWYMPYQEDELSRVQSRFKWIYPGAGTGWPRVLLSGSGWETVYTHMADVPGSTGSPRQYTNGRVVFIDRDSTLGDDSTNGGVGPQYWDPYYDQYTENSWKIGPNLDADITTAVLYPNTWYLVKIHYDVSVLGEGTFEMWMREHGQPFRKTHEWISGQDAPTLDGLQFSGGAFEWGTTYTGTFPGIKVGSTIGWDTDGTHMYVYMDDFALASTEASLPTYDDGVGPVRSSGSPSGALTAGTTSTTLSLSTAAAATCGYSTNEFTLYANMTAFTTTGGTSHSQSLTGLTDGSTYNYYVRCDGGAGAVNTSDYHILFSVAEVVNGACGTNHQGSFAENTLTSGTSGNCSAGTVTSFSGTGPWTWGCAGSNGGTSVTDCSASLQAVGGGTGRAPYSATARVPYSATSFARYYEEVSP